MAIKIKFDNNNIPQMPTLVLGLRTGGKIGVIPAHNINVTDSFASSPEMSFAVYKEDASSIWDMITDFKCVWWKETNQWYELYVDKQESDSVYKSCSLIGLGEAELSQAIAHNIEINTEDDIARDDYVVTIFYNAQNADASLLDRILYKTKNWVIGHVDSGLAKVQRTFSFDNKNIYDCLDEISETVGCHFDIQVYTDEDTGEIVRQIDAYDMMYTCEDCGYRGNADGVCPECGSQNISGGYGEDTSVFISRENLAEEIDLSVDTDSVKNCFHLEAGDDLMTATVANVNPNGSLYLWYFTEDMLNDMPSDLSAAIQAYVSAYNSIYNNSSISLSSSLVEAYNNIVSKYQEYDSVLTTITSPLSGYKALAQAYYDVIDLDLLLRDELMPSVDTSTTSASQEATNLVQTGLGTIGVTSLSSMSKASADNAVLSMAKTIVDPNYSVKVASSTYTTGSSTWKGTFTITSYVDEDETATTTTMTATLDEDLERYTKDKITKLLSNQSEDIVNADVLFDLDNTDLDEFTAELEKYCLSRLTDFENICQSCLDILIANGIGDADTWSSSDPNLYDDLYLPYYNRLLAIQAEMVVREDELAIISGTTDADGNVLEAGMKQNIESQRNAIQSQIDFESYLGETLSNQLIPYRREATYSNSNYISDGLTNSELVSKAEEFISAARSELVKEATAVHNLSADLEDLLVIPAFHSLTQYFVCGNYIRMKVDGSVYKLRLTQYSIDFDNLDKIDVEFSDAEEVVTGIDSLRNAVESANLMASTYGATVKKSKRGANANTILETWVDDSLSLTNTKIVNNNEEQNVVSDEHGMLFREYQPITEDYADEQIKIVNKGLYYTTDNWLTVKAGIGKFIYLDPENNFTETEGYGVIADTIVGNIVLSKDIGIYNSSGSFTANEDGVTITTINSSGIGNTNAFTIQDNDGNKFVYIDSDGNINLNGKVMIDASGTYSSDDSSVGGLVQTAKDAKQTADQTANYFIWDSTGEYITSTSGEKDSGYNIKLTSAGIYLRYGTTVLGGFTSSSTLANQIENYGYITSSGNLTGTINGTNASTVVSNAANGASAYTKLYSLYGLCSTAAGTKKKTVTVGSGFSLTTGATIHVTFVYANTASSPTLSVNSTDPKSIYINGSAAKSGAWQAYECLTLVYNGTRWDAVGASNLTADNITTGTLDASVVTVTNLNASNITTGTLDASVVTVTNLTASDIKLGGLMEVDQSLSTTTVGGYIGYGEGKTAGNSTTTTGITVQDATKKSYLICTNAGARLTYKNGTSGADAYVGGTSSVAGYFEIDLWQSGTKTGQIYVGPTGNLSTNGSLSAGNGAFIANASQVWLANNVFLNAYKNGSTSSGYILIGLNSSDIIGLGSSACQLNIHESGTVNVDHPAAWAKAAGILSAKGATYISSGANLKSTKYLNVGTYYCANDSESAGITNCPTSHAFIMWVYSPLGDGDDSVSSDTWVYRVRKIMDYTGNIYIQSVSSGSTAGSFTYNSWKTVTMS